jgi:hypothetical protein
MDEDSEILIHQLSLTEPDPNVVVLDVLSSAIEHLYSDVLIEDVSSHVQEFEPLRHVRFGDYERGALVGFIDSVDPQ